MIPKVIANSQISMHSDVELSDTWHIDVFAACFDFKMV